jgi:hypothetical protein
MILSSFTHPVVCFVERFRIDLTEKLAYKIRWILISNVAFALMRSMILQVILFLYVLFTRGYMMIDHFTREQFELALPRDKSANSLCKYNGLVDGEHTYTLTVSVFVKIMIRSSVWGNNRSADTGDDSIRAWLVDMKGNCLSTKTQRWVTRQKGWEKRLIDMLRTLYGWGLKSDVCQFCGKPRHVFKVHKAGPNHNRIFAKCTEKSCETKNTWVWIGE